MSAPVKVFGCRLSCPVLKQFAVLSSRALALSQGGALSRRKFAIRRSMQGEAERLQQFARTSLGWGLECQSRAAWSSGGHSACLEAAPALGLTISAPTRRCAQR